jgi:hypothetical protein
MAKKMKRGKLSRARLMKILKKLDKIEETPANASQIRAIENRIDGLLKKYK